MCFGMTTTQLQTTIPSNDIQYAGKYNLGFAQGLACLRRAVSQRDDEEHQP